MTFRVNVSWANLPDGKPGRKPTIYEALKAKLGREPSNAELCADVQRILTDGLIERAEQGKLKHQRRGVGQ